MEKLDAPESTSVPAMLLLNDGAVGEDELSQLMLPEAKHKNERPSAMIDPSEGFCVKCRLDDSQKTSNRYKVFVNMMYDDAIPPPSEPLASISDAGLADLLEEGTDDSTAALRIPMSLGAPRTHKDKGGEECRICDVVINSAFFSKVEASLIMKTFLITVTLDGLEQKTDGPKKDVMLKERETKTVKRTVDSASLGGNGDTKAQPKFVIRRVAQDCVSATIQLPDAVRGDDVALEMNDDRMIVKTPEHDMDVFLPVSMDFEKCTAEFDVKERVLRAFIPLKVK